MSSDSEKPKRLSLSQIVEMLLTRTPADRSAVTIARNAKGETQIEVKVQAGGGEDVVTVEDAEQKAREVYERLHALYPPANGHDNASVSLTRNAKGETQIAVELKTAEGSVPTLAAAAEATRETYNNLQTNYPVAS
jgi:hypothetical protein